jgi:hypothetical protein
LKITEQDVEYLIQDIKKLKVRGLEKIAVNREMWEKLLDYIENSTDKVYGKYESLEPITKIFIFGVEVNLSNV